MLSFWLTLVDDAYPLICPVASSPTFDQTQALEPGCWFSTTIGLSAASVELAGARAAQANRPSMAATTIRLIETNPNFRKDAGQSGKYRNRKGAIPLKLRPGRRPARRKPQQAARSRTPRPRPGDSERAANRGVAR